MAAMTTAIFDSEFTRVEVDLEENVESWLISQSDHPTLAISSPDEASNK
jgi:hypothetical protein